MKLKDYLKEFEGIDPEAEVYFNMSVGCCGETEALENPDVSYWATTTKDPKTYYVQVNFPSFEFLDSCRKYGSVICKANK